MILTKSGKYLKDCLKIPIIKIIEARSINDLIETIYIANELNNFFSNIEPNLADKIPTSNSDLDFEPIPNEPLLELQVTTEKITNC